MDKFERVEIKYILDQNKYKKLISKLNKYIKKDIFYKATICNLYLDSNDFTLINASLQKPLYKEKIRIRSYNIPKINDEVYLEIKKKYNEIVAKRRIKLKLCDIYAYLNNKKEIPHNQNFKEIDYVIK